MTPEGESGEAYNARSISRCIFPAARLFTRIFSYVVSFSRSFFSLFFFLFPREAYHFAFLLAATLQIESVYKRETLIAALYRDFLPGKRASSHVRT